MRRHGLKMQFTGLGSMIGVHMTDGRSATQPMPSSGDAALLDLFYFDLLARGIWFAKRGMMALSVALDEADADKLVAAVEDSTRRVRCRNLACRRHASFAHAGGARASSVQ